MRRRRMIRCALSLRLIYCSEYIIFSVFGCFVKMISKGRNFKLFHWYLHVHFLTSESYYYKWVVCKYVKENTLSELCSNVFCSYILVRNSHTVTKYWLCTVFVISDVHFLDFFFTVLNLQIIICKASKGVKPGKNIPVLNAMTSNGYSHNI